MRLGVRGKLFLVSLLVILAVGLASGAYLERTLKHWIESRVELELLRHARTVRDVLDIVDLGVGRVSTDTTADRLGRSFEARVTIIASSGAVVGDSEVDEESLAAVDNHHSRPEVLEALAFGEGRARRYSETLGVSSLYVAVALPDRGVARISTPLSGVGRAVRRLRLALLFAALFGLGLAVFMSGLASQLFTRPLRTLVHNARSVLEQEGGRLRVASTDEIGRLAGSFNRVFDDLELTVATLAGERDHLKTILEGMREGVLAVDAGRRITRINRAAMEFLGVHDGVIGCDFDAAIDLPELVETTHATSLAEGAEAKEIDLPVGRRVSVQWAPLRTTSGFVLVLRDVTEMRRLEAIRRDFVANVSHELRTPVSVIRANSETLIDGALDDRERAVAFLGAIHRNSERLSHLIGDLLDLARIESGEYVLNLQVVGVQKAVQHAVESVVNQGKGQRQDVSIEVDQSLRVVADVRALDQVLLNLIGNAVKYAADGGEIVVRAIEIGKIVRVEVRDNGPGIAPKYRERIFQRFYRVDPGRSREMGGTGLGLAIVKHLVNAMAGEVGFESASPQGSIFWFEIPRETAS